MPKVRLEDIEVNYLTLGEGRPLLLLHGNDGSLASFGGVAERLARYHKIYLIDTRWHGGTPRGEKPFTYMQLCEDLLGFVSALKLEHPDIIGYSDGGVTALSYAARTQNVGKVIAMGANWNISGCNEDFARYCRRTVFWSRMFGVFPKMRRKLALTKLMVTPSAYPHEHELVKIKSSVLLMVGDADVIPYEHTVWIKERISDCNIRVVPDCGHSIMKMQPEIFIKTAEEFFAPRFEKRQAGFST